MLLFVWNCFISSEIVCYHGFLVHTRWNISVNVLAVIKNKVLCYFGFKVVFQNFFTQPCHSNVVCFCCFCFHYWEDETIAGIKIYLFWGITHYTDRALETSSCNGVIILESRIISRKVCIQNPMPQATYQKFSPQHLLQMYLYTKSGMSKLRRGGEGCLLKSLREFSPWVKIDISCYKTNRKMLTSESCRFHTEVHMPRNKVLTTNISNTNNIFN